MSGFAGIFRFDGAPPDTTAVAAMVEAIAYRGPNGITTWSGKGAALTHLKLSTTRESVDEIQPLVSDDGRRILVMDGWLANPAELRDQLTARGIRLRAKSDAELVLAAYEMWGDESPRYIEGEFAFIVWDAARREAFCAMDHAGLRPLHYHWDGRRLLVASDLAGVLAAGDFPQRTNVGMLAEHLTNEWYSTDETLWQDVMRVPPAQTMRVSARGLRLQRHWAPPLEVSIRYPRDEDYQAHYRELFVDSVKRASRSHRPVACEVSGGLDSSAIFAIAERLRVNHQLPAPGLVGYTYKFGDEVDDDVEEIEYARAMAAHLGTPVCEIQPFLPDLDWFIERGRKDRDLAAYPNAAMAVAIGTALVADGSVVALNGEGGDEFLASSYPLNYAEDLAARDWPSLGAALREDYAAFGLRGTMHDFVRFGLAPLVPKPLRNMRHKIAGRPRSMGRMLLTKEAIALLEQRRRAMNESLPVATRNPARRAKFMSLEYGSATYTHDFLSRNSARLGYELRSPFFARPLLEFVLAIPERQRRRGDFQKFMHVKAMGGDLPPLVAERRTKAEFSLSFKRQLDNARDYVLRGNCVLELA